MAGARPLLWAVLSLALGRAGSRARGSLIPVADVGAASFKRRERSSPARPRNYGASPAMLPHGWKRGTSAPSSVRQLRSCFPRRPSPSVLGTHKPWPRFCWDAGPLMRECG